MIYDDSIASISQLVSQSVLKYIMISPRHSLSLFITLHYSLSLFITLYHSFITLYHSSSLFIIHSSLIARPQLIEK
jgi:hypothetical protein